MGVHLVNYLNYDDLDLVLRRIPEEHKTRLGKVLLRQGAMALNALGSVTARGRKDIELYSILPPRISLRQTVDKGQSPVEFGAPRRGQWPPWAVRRFMLYDTLLHELGHLQMIHPKAKRWKRKYAAEPKAREFAARLRAELWAQPFAHPDPVHNPPDEDELDAIDLWERLNKKQRCDLVMAVVDPHRAKQFCIEELSPLRENQAAFLKRGLAAAKMIKSEAYVSMNRQDEKKREQMPNGHLAGRERQYQEACHLRDSGDCSGAVEVLLKCTERWGDSVKAFVLFGDLYKVLGRREESIESFRRAIEMQPHNQAASLGLFHVLWDKGEERDEEAETQAFEEIRRFMDVSSAPIYKDIINDLYEKKDTLWPQE